MTTTPHRCSPAAIELTDAVIGLSGARHTSRLVAIWKGQADARWKLEADVFI